MVTRAPTTKEWRDSIRTAVNEVRDNGGKKTKSLRLLARKLVDRALEGEVAAMREIGDRLDGRPAQALQVTGEDGGPIEVKTYSTMESARMMLALMRDAKEEQEADVVAESRPALTLIDQADVGRDVVSPEATEEQ